MALRKKRARNNEDKDQQKETELHNQDTKDEPITPDTPNNPPKITSKMPLFLTKSDKNRSKKNQEFEEPSLLFDSDF